MKLTDLIASTLAQTTGSLIALHTGDPGADGSANELSGDGYARAAGTYTISGDTATLDDDAVFGPASGDWGTITHVTIWASDGTTGLWSGALTASKTVLTGDELVIKSGDLTIQET